jgi:arabinosaccharide transport system substrate-binding protein
MIDRFPFGKAPFWLLMLALGSALFLLAAERKSSGPRPDLVFAIFAPNHLPAYERIVADFEKKHDVHISLQLVHQRALQERLQNAMLAGTAVPDLVELIEGSLGFFTRGPLSEVGFVDLTERLEHEGYRQRMVESRFSVWSAQNHVFAVPHDVHPVMLMYRADLVEALGIDVTKLETWDDFVAVGQSVVKDLDGDGVIDRYMIDLPASEAWGLGVLLRQRGISWFDGEGRIAFNNDVTVDTMLWYLHQSYGKNRIAWECGSGQPLMKAMKDGLALFYVAPDWRTFVTEQDSPNLTGKMKVMPLPAWERGGRRTSVWGGTGLAITKSARRRELAWQFAKELYFNKGELGKRFLQNNILPPFKEAWSEPEFHVANAYFSGQRLGEAYAALATDTPPSWTSAYSRTADGKVSEVFLRAGAYYKQHGDDGLREFIERELQAAYAYVAAIMARNRFLKH